MKVILCRPCMEYLKRKGHELRLVKAEANRKITCEKCGRRRFGSEYEELKNERI